MIGTWPLRNDDERTELAYLIANLPADGRYEVVIRKSMTVVNCHELLERMKERGMMRSRDSD